MESRDQIEAFLMDRMSAEEKSSFAARMDSDPILKKEVDEMQTFILGIETATLKKKLSGINEQSQEGRIIDLGTPKIGLGTSDEKGAIRSSFGWWAKAASVLFLVGVGGWFLLRAPSVSDDLFAQYYYADPGLQTQMGAADNYDFADAMVDYKTGDYESATQKWLTQLASAPDNDTLNYYLGAAYINAKTFKIALPYLQKVIDQETSAYNHKAKWYWTLVNLRQGNIRLIEEKWNDWEMLEVKNSLYPLDELWQQIPAD